MKTNVQTAGMRMVAQVYRRMLTSRRAANQAVL